MELLQIHLSALILTALCILYADHLGLLYFLGKKETLPAQTISWLHRLIWVGLLTLIATGAAMTLPAADYYFSNPAFLTKIGFVLVLVVNGVAIGRLSKVASLRPYATLAPTEKRTLLISGALSAISWTCATTIGFFFL